MGALPILHGEHASEEPAEPHDEGCPGAWYRCTFVRSLAPYERHVSGGGGYSSNPTFDRCDDPLVHEAVQYLEHERARALAHQRELMR